VHRVDIDIPVLHGMTPAIIVDVLIIATNNDEFSL